MNPAKFVHFDIPESLNDATGLTNRYGYLPGLCQFSRNNALSQLKKQNKTVFSYFPSAIALLFTVPWCTWQLLSQHIGLNRLQGYAYPRNMKLQASKLKHCWEAIESSVWPSIQNIPHKVFLHENPPTKNNTLEGIIKILSIFYMEIIWHVPSSDDWLNCKFARIRITLTLSQL